MRKNRRDSKIFEERQDGRAERIFSLIIRVCITLVFENNIVIKALSELLAYTA